MSLKAKIEAVIYASEEPVTLAQLTGLLGEEGQAELDTLAAQQHSLALEDESALDPDPDSSEPGEDVEALNAETIVPTEAAETEPSTEAAEPVTEVGVPEPALSLSKGLASETWEAEPTNSAEPTAAAIELAEKKLARDAAATVKLRERRLRDYFRSLLEELIADYANGDRGLEIREVAGGFRLGTKAEYHDAVRGFVKSLKPPLKLTLQALETLAVVAYKQPVTAPEVSEIRGVDSAGVLGSLLARKLVTTAGRKQVIGRPILYKTTKDFLLRFGLKDINELPSIEEFEKMAGELNDAVQEEIPMESPAAEHAASSEEASANPIELEGHNLQPLAPDAPTSEPESIPEAESISQADAYPAGNTPDDPDA
jgi:segregation and condensation protein B